MKKYQKIGTKLLLTILASCLINPYTNSFAEDINTSPVLPSTPPTPSESANPSYRVNPSATPTPSSIPSPSESPSSQGTNNTSSISTGSLSGSNSLNFGSLNNPKTQPIFKKKLEKALKTTTINGQKLHDTCPIIQIVTIVGSNETSPNANIYDTKGVAGNINNYLLNKFVRKENRKYYSAIYVPYDSSNGIGSNSYDKTVIEATKNTSEIMSDVKEACPNVKFITTGHSKGAQALHILDALNGNNQGPVLNDSIIQSYLFSDPLRTPGSNTVADGTSTPKNQSLPFQIKTLYPTKALYNYSPQGGGVLGAYPGIPTDFGELNSKVINICQPGDWACDMPKNSLLAQLFARTFSKVDLKDPFMVLSSLASIFDPVAVNTVSALGNSFTGSSIGNLTYAPKKSILESINDTMQNSEVDTDEFSNAISNLGGIGFNTVKSVAKDWLDPTEWVQLVQEFASNVPGLASKGINVATAVGGALVAGGAAVAAGLAGGGAGAIAGGVAGGAAGGVAGTPLAGIGAIPLGAGGATLGSVLGGIGGGLAAAAPVAMAGLAAAGPGLVSALSQGISDLLPAFLQLPLAVVQKLLPKALNTIISITPLGTLNNVAQLGLNELQHLVTDNVGMLSLVLDFKYWNIIGNHTSYDRDPLKTLIAQSMLEATLPVLAAAEDDMGEVSKDVENVETTPTSNGYQVAVKTNSKENNNVKNLEYDEKTGKGKINTTSNKTSNSSETENSEDSKDSENTVKPTVEMLNKKIVESKNLISNPLKYTSATTLTSAYHILFPNSDEKLGW